MRRRIDYEHEAIQLLLRQGFHCLRSAGSRGPADIFAVAASEIRMIQVKSTKRLGHRATASMLRDAVLGLQTLPSPPNSSKWLFVRNCAAGGSVSALMDFRRIEWNSGSGSSS